jgi:hypothetical protein
MKKLSDRTGLSLAQLALLAGGDLLVILSFVWVGRESHHLSLTDFGASLFTALPFIVGWFGVMPWFGIYNARVSQDGRSLAPRLLGGWLVAGSVALVLRTLLLGRPLPWGIIPTFAVISLAYIGLVALLWRLAYIWWLQRSPKGTRQIREA